MKGEKGKCSSCQKVRVIVWKTPIGRYCRKCERERQIADELERITNGTSCEVNRLIAELRGEGE